MVEIKIPGCARIYVDEATDGAVFRDFPSGKIAGKFCALVTDGSPLVDLPTIGRTLADGIGYGDNMIAAILAAIADFKNQIIEVTNDNESNHNQH